MANQQLETDNTNEAKKKLIQIYSFLQSLDQLRNPVKKIIDEQLWRLWFGDLPEHEDIECELIDLLKQSGVGQKEVDTHLVVRRPELTDCPSPPEGILKWLLSGWHQIENEPEILDTSEENNADTISELFEDDIFRKDQFNKWNDERKKWKISEKPARDTMKVFERLYSLYAQIEREQEQVELILGDGILDWETV